MAWPYPQRLPDDVRWGSSESGLRRAGTVRSALIFGGPAVFARPAAEPGGPPSTLCVGFGDRLVEFDGVGWM
jgi:hypothetical protein